MTSRVTSYDLIAEHESDLNYFSGAMHDVIAIVASILDTTEEIGAVSCTIHLDCIRAIVNPRTITRLFTLSHDRLERLLINDQTLRDLAISILRTEFPDFVCKIVTQRNGVVIGFVKKYKES